MNLTLQEAIDFKDGHLVFGSDPRTFRLGTPLGRGKTFDAYEGQDYMGNRVAIKICHQALSEKELWDYVTVYANLRNTQASHVLRIHGLYRDPDTSKYYFIQDLISGTTFTLENVPTMCLSRELACLESLLSTLSSFYDCGYLILDIKPANLFKPGDRQSLVLFDLDSALDADKSLPFNYNSRYAPPEVLQPDIGDIGPFSSIYMAVKLLYERLFHTLPDRKGLSVNQPGSYREQWLEKAAFPFHVDYETDLSEELYDFFCKELGFSPARRSQSFKEVIETIHNMHIQAAKAEDAVLYANAHNNFWSSGQTSAEHIFFRILYEHPVFSYAEPGADRLNILITGKHTLRLYALRAILSCVHMLDKKLNIYLCMPDALAFWQNCSAMCPALKKAVVICYGEKQYSSLDTDLVEHEIATLFLLPVLPKNTGSATLSENEIAAFAAENKIHYLFALDSSSDKNMALISSIAAYRDKTFIAYIGNAGPVFSDADSYAISPYQSDNESGMFYSELFNSAWQIHKFYSQGIAGREMELKNAFRNSPYYINSSERAVVHLVYKLASVGLNARSPEAAEQFRSKILSGSPEVASALRRLSFLEHFSWSAYMIVHGTDRATLADVATYAYQDDNDWRKKSGTTILMHPCMAASRADSPRLPAGSWENENVDLYDPLDRFSLLWNRFCRELALKRQPEIQALLEQLDESGHPCAADLKSAAQGCLSMSGNYSEKWETCLKACQEQSASAPEGTVDILSRLSIAMRPVLEAGRQRDFKESDEAIIRSIPLLLECLS